MKDVPYYNKYQEDRPSAKDMKAQEIGGYYVHKSFGKYHIHLAQRTEDITHIMPLSFAKDLTNLQNRTHNMERLMENLYSIEALEQLHCK